MSQVLVVDDYDDARLMVEMILEDAGSTCCLRPMAPRA
jgi:CheY-like chemotaxis protein